MISAFNRIESIPLNCVVHARFYLKGQNKIEKEEFFSAPIKIKVYGSINAPSLQWRTITHGKAEKDAAPHRGITYTDLSGKLQPTSGPLADLAEFSDKKIDGKRRLKLSGAGHFKRLVDKEAIEYGRKRLFPIGAEDYASVIELIQPFSSRLDNKETEETHTLWCR